jgi:hypothetical protein
MDNFEVLQGTSLPLNFNLSDKQGNALLDYTGSETLTGYVTPGKNRPALFLVPVDWVEPAAGAVKLLVTGLQTATMDPGRYRGYVIVDDPVVGPLVAYKWAMTLLAGPGPLPGSPGYVAPPAPKPVYTDLDSLQDAARGWFQHIDAQNDDAGFQSIIERASRWLDELIIARCTSPGSGEWTPGESRLIRGTDEWLRDILTRGGLRVDDWVREAVTYRALAMILDGTAPSKEADYAGLANRFRGRSYNEATARTAAIRSEPEKEGSHPDIWVNLGAGTLR